MLAWDFLEFKTCWTEQSAKWKYGEQQSLTESYNDGFDLCDLGILLIDSEKADYSWSVNAWENPYLEFIRLLEIPCNLLN